MYFFRAYTETWAKNALTLKLTPDRARQGVRRAGRLPGCEHGQNWEMPGFVGEARCFLLHSWLDACCLSAHAGRFGRSGHVLLHQERRV